MGLAGFYPGPIPGGRGFWLSSVLLGSPWLKGRPGNAGALHDSALQVVRGSVIVRRKANARSYRKASVLDDMRRRLDLGLDESALAICRGVVTGLHRAKGAGSDGPLGWAPDFLAEEACHAVAELIRSCPLELAGRLGEGQPEPRTSPSGARARPRLGRDDPRRNPSALIWSHLPGVLRENAARVIPLSQQRPAVQRPAVVVGTREVPENRRIVNDELIELTGSGAAEKCPYPLRRVAVEDPDTGETLVFLTNHLTFGATTIARIYRDRWQIELLFKALKQNLKVKTFVGTSANALHTQIWTALIALLLLS